jgi:peptidoglycan/xylan/chitin deacetylase (PgdA/CDA1 family)
VRRRTDVVVLCYHAVSDTWPIGMAIRPASLERHVRWLLEHGYEPATFHDAVVAPSAPRTFALTFDDAWASIFEHGFPVLSALGVPATVFTLTDAPGPPVRRLRGPILEPLVGGPHEHELMPMSWDQLRTLQDAGWEIGSHTRSHPFLTTVDDDRLGDELAASKLRCEEMLGRPCRTIAYPSGDFDARVVRFARAAGYAVAGTLPVRFDRDPDPLAYPRVSIQRDDSIRTFATKVSRVTRLVRTTALWPALERARRARPRFS